MSFFFHYTVSAVLIVKLLKQIFEIFETLLFLTLVAIPTRIPVETHKIGDRQSMIDDRWLMIDRT